MAVDSPDLEDSGADDADDDSPAVGRAPDSDAAVDGSSEGLPDSVGDAGADSGPEDGAADSEGASRGLGSSWLADGAALSLGSAARLG
ncbi:hypothetical protein, partial [Mycolicibacterium grossiae]|uniref:hypothetical protein n=1 Tax=Mycolicibacterium grossiae TaxID=1552759 RepID=UPI001C407A9F